MPHRLGCSVTSPTERNRCLSACPQRLRSTALSVMTPAKNNPIGKRETDPSWTRQPFLLISIFGRAKGPRQAIRPVAQAIVDQPCRGNGTIAIGNGCRWFTNLRAADTRSFSMGLVLDHGMPAVFRPPASGFEQSGQPMTRSNKDHVEGRKCQNHRYCD